jgi:hypothetical protein
MTKLRDMVSILIGDVNELSFSKFDGGRNDRIFEFDLTSINFKWMASDCSADNL